MKKILTLFLLIFGLSSITAWAEGVLWVDYCDGQKSASSTIDKTNEDVELAIRFSQEQLAGFAGNEIRQIAIGWPKTGPGSEFTVWVRKSLTGENLVQQTAASGSGWQEIVLDTPYAIDGTSECYVGVSFKPSSTRNSYISLAGTTHPDGGFYRIGSAEWASYATLEKGSLAIRAGINGPNMPQHDLVVTEFTTSRGIFAIGDKVPATVTVLNNGFDDCTNPVLKFSIAGNVVGETVMKGTASYGKTITATFDVPTDIVTAEGTLEITAEAFWADGVADRVPADNKMAKTVEMVTPEFDLMLVAPKVASSLFKIGDPIGVTGTIKNLNLLLVVDPVLRYSFNGGAVTGEVVIKSELEYGKSQSFAVVIPTRGLTEEGDLTIDFELVPASGVDDIDPSNNVATVSGLRVERHPFIRKMVMEEATGTWCGWCVRGIVAMEQLNQQYPERFVGIAIHASDKMQASFGTGLDYLNWINGKITGYPSCILNREPKVYDPSPTTMVNYMKGATMQKKAEAELTVNAVNNNGTITMNADAYFRTSSAGRKFFVLFAITEDHIMDTQSNYYAGGSSGKMGGYENMPNSVPVDYMDVARGIWPSTEGSSTCALPASVEAEQTYSASYSVKTGDFTFKNESNLNVVALLVDGETRGILNAAKCEVGSLEGINTVLAPAVSSSEGAYNLAGQRVNGAQRGIVIENGRKILRMK